MIYLISFIIFVAIELTMAAFFHWIARLSIYNDDFFIKTLSFIVESGIMIFWLYWCGFQSEKDNKI